MPSFFNPISIICILIAISVHEWAHAFTADRLGDPTPDRHGRLTLNPIAHIDPLGAIMFLIVGFGWAKPVPVSSGYFKHPKRDYALVALAGPFSNLVLAIIAYVLLFFAVMGTGLSPMEIVAGGTTDVAAWQMLLIQLLQGLMFINLILMAFNLLPIAPLDGSNILRLFIPYSQEDAYDNLMKYGPYILLGIIVAENILHIRILSWWVFGIMEFVLRGFDAVAGIFY